MASNNSKFILHLVWATALVSSAGIFVYSYYYNLVKLPKPTGSYAIGTTEYHLVDENRKEPHIADASFQRELMVQVWYPTSVKNLPKALYMPSKEGVHILKKDIVKIFNATDEKLLFLHDLYTHASSYAPLATTLPKYPVIIFSPGAGAPVAVYSTLLEDLASQGYVVVGINYPYQSNPVIFPDGRIIQKIETDDLKREWKLEKEEDLMAREQAIFVEDIQFVLRNIEQINTKDPQNIFTGKLDLNRIGLMGHSFGGGASINACSIDTRCKAIVNIDGRFTYSSYFDQGFNKPLMFIRNTFHKQDKKDQLLQQLQRMTGSQEYHEIPEMLHGSFMDIALFVPEKDVKNRKVDAAAGLKETRKLLVAFFNKYLN